ncbi:MAG: hypothetical protein ACRD96_18240 [Bryobacteraceae bacterium]
MKKPALAGLLFIAAVVAYLLYSTLGQAQYRVEVCMSFNERTQCRTAGAATAPAALRTATENACALIAGGVDDTTSCQSKKPESVKWLAGKK